MTTDDKEVFRVINEIKTDTEVRMKKSLDALAAAFNKIRTGRAHPSILDGVLVPYYGADTPLSQVASISVLDNRTLSISPWERHLTPEIEKAILKSDLGLNPTAVGELIRLPMPMLTEETRRGFIKQAKLEAENARVSIRAARREAMGDLKYLLKEKELSEDEERRGQDKVQQITDKFIADVEKMFEAKEKDLMEV